MSLWLLAFAALAGGGDSPKLQRVARDHTIYRLHGSSEQLARFEADVGSQWQGGRLLSKNDREYRYWAFAERTAPQARQFMFGSMMGGLKLDIQEYREVQFFPNERAELDKIALECGFAIDPFFLTPTRELQMGYAPKATLKNTECGLAAIEASVSLRALPLVLVGNEAPAERGK